MSTFHLWRQLVSDLPVLFPSHELFFFHIFSSCSFEEQEWESGVLEFCCCGVILPQAGREDSQPMILGLTWLASVEEDYACLALIWF